jgi:flagellar protein FliO/FliZ
MTKIFAFLFGLSLCLLTTISFAHETADADEVIIVDSTAIESISVKNSGVGNTNVANVEKQQKTSESLTGEKTPEVGKHVLANMNASSMILSLLMVLGLIIISALVLKRFNLTQQNSSQLKVIASLSLGTKERVIIVQIGEEQLVLGVCPQQISLLRNLETPIDIQAGKPLALTGNVLSFLQKNSIKTTTTSNKATSNTTSKK